MFGRRHAAVALLAFLVGVAAATGIAIAGETTTSGGFDGELNWSDRINETEKDGLAGMQEDAAGNLVVVGNNDFEGFIAEYAPNGTQRWRKQYTEPHSFLQLDSQGNLVTTSGYGPDTVRKYTPDGQLLWERDTGIGRLVGVEVLSNDDILAVGGPFSQNETVFARYTPNGSLVWKRSTRLDINGAGPQFSGSDAQDDIYVTYQGQEPRNSVQLLAKFDDSANLVWTKTWDRSASRTEFLVGVTTDSNGNVITAGLHSVGRPNAVDIYKLDANGTELWRDSFETFPGFVNYVETNGDDEITLMTGVDSNMTAIHYGPDGTPLWRWSWASPSLSFGVAARWQENRLYMAGTDLKEGFLRTDGLLFKYTFKETMQPGFVPDEAKENFPVLPEPAQEHNQNPSDKPAANPRRGPLDCTPNSFPDHVPSLLPFTNIDDSAIPNLLRVYCTP